MRAATRCGRCAEPVLWVRLPTGRAMPVDLEPDPAGTVAVRRDATGRHLGHVVSKELPAMPYETLHVTHFATCAPTVAHLQGVRDGQVIDLTRRMRGRR